MKVKEENEKAGLKLNIQNLSLWHLVQLSKANRWEKVKAVTDFIFLVTVDGDYSHKIVACSLEEKLWEIWTVY